MKKKLILKLIESNDTPKHGDLGYDSYDPSDLFILNTSIWKQSLDNFKVIKPIAISDEEIKVGDNVYENNLSDEYVYTVYMRNNKLGIFRFSNVFVPLDKANCKKIELLPEHFSNDILQLIIDGVLVDDSEIEVEYGDLDSPYADVQISDSNGHAIISIPESNTNEVSKIMYSKEEMYLNMQYYMEHIQSKPNYYITPQEWLATKKHF